MEPRKLPLPKGDVQTFTPEERKSLTKPVLLSWALRFMSCAICGDRLTKGFCDDHIKPLSMGGTNEVLNRQPLCKGCHARKTADEAPLRAEADRMGGRRGSQWARRQKNGSKMESAPFYKHPTKKRTVGGGVVDR